MKTTILKKVEINKKWYVIDAKDKTLGRMCTIIADKLRGKDKPCFSPHMDCGDYIIVINSDEVKLTGNKLEDKSYYRHSGYPGGFKEKKAKDMNSKDMITLAVSGMLPRNKLKKVFLEKLKVFNKEAHPHEAQNPETLEV